MPIPNYQEIMLPLLALAGDGQTHHIREARDRLAEQFGLTEDERRELLPSGKQLTFDNRVGWARTYMTKAGLLEVPRRSHFVITPRGKEVLASGPKNIDVNYLERFPEFIAFRSLRRERIESLVDEAPVTFGEASP